MTAKLKDQAPPEVAVAHPTGESVDVAAFARKMQRRYPKILKRLGE